MSRVKNKQNEPDMLRVQYAARFSFNQAETLNDFIWILCIFSVLTALIPNFVSETWQLGIPIIIDLIILLCGWRLSVNISLASSLREYFDSYVLGIGFDMFDRSTKEYLSENALKIEQKNPADAKIQMAHTGRDNPPGVKNWYELPETTSPEDESYECQRQNCWWNDKLMKTRLFRSFIAVFILLGITIVIHKLFNLNLLKTILCCGPIIVRLVERVAVNFRYILISYKIDGIVENLSESRTEENILNLQILINDRRKMPVLERNYLHKHRAKSYSEELQNIKESSQSQR